MPEDIDLNVAENQPERSRAGAAFLQLLLLVAVAIAAVMLVFETLKQLVAPHMTIRQSHMVTVAFSMIAGTTGAYFILRDRDKLYGTALSEIEERKQVEADLRQSEEKYRTLFETMAQGVVYHDSDGKITSANPAAEKMLGLTADRMKGKRPTDPAWRAIREDGSEFPREEHPALVALRTGQEVRNVVVGVFNAREGGYRWININAIPQFRSGENRPCQVYASFDDVTEQKRSKELSDALNSVNAVIGSTLEVDEIMRRVIVESNKAMGSEAALIAMREGCYWVTRYTHGFPYDVVGMRLTDEQEPVSALAAAVKEPIVVNDAYVDERVNDELMKRFSVRSFLCVPLMARGSVVGMLTFVYLSAPVSFSDAQADFARKLGSSFSIAMENAQLYAAERDIAETLQEALLVMPQEIKGIEFGYVYRSATGTTRVGGDFYDLFEIDDARVGIVIGDISGKGLQAATLMSVVKNSIRTCAYGGAAPASVMARANTALVRQSPARSFVTAFFGVLERETGRFTYCSAGHPPAIVKRKSGETTLLEVRSPMVGAFASFEYVDSTETLEEGDMLVLYTDGVIEARRDRGFFGEDRLLALVGDRRPGGAQELTRAIFDAVSAYTGGALSDDVALLVVSLNARTEQKPG